jgi:Flp pilus assembly protein TadG
MTMQSHPKLSQSRKPRRFGFLFGAGRRRSQRGQAMVELAVALPLLLIVIAGAVDFGTACYIAIEVTSAARAGAQYGVQNAATMVDITGMQLAAQNEAQNISTTCNTLAGRTCWVSGYPVATYGCECADGTGVTPTTAICTSCSNGNHFVNYVSVVTQATYTPMIPWPGIKSSYTFNGNAKLRLGTQ